MSRQKVLFAFLCVLCFFPLEAVYACLPYTPSVRVTCMDGQYDYLSPYYSPNPTKDAPPIHTTDAIDLAMSLCATDLSAGHTQISALLDNYFTTYSNYNRGNFELTPYSPERIREMELSNLNLLTCHAYRYEIIEYWLVSYGYVPDYCSVESLSLALCGGVFYHIDLPHFISYLVTYPTFVNSVYLVGIGAIAFAGWHWWRQRGLRNMLAATPLALIIFLVACPSLFMLTLDSGFSLDIGTLGWAVMVWVLAKGVKYGAVKVWRRWRKVETPV